jgi:hypothetical protein
MHFFAQGPLQAGFIAYLLQIDPDPRVMHPHFDSPLEALTTQTPTSPPPLSLQGLVDLGKYTRYDKLLNLLCILHNI